MLGTQIGSHRIVGMLGAGGMGSVYLAEHVVLKERRAIKVLDPRFTNHGPVVARFIDEARATAALRHRNLVRVFDVGQLPDGHWFTVMEYLEGLTLARFMEQQGGPMKPHLVVHTLAPVLACMLWVHAHQVVHRDLKPENVFLIRKADNPHFVKVLDLGVAQMSDDFASGPQTKTGTVIGTPPYMSPEGLRGQTVTAAADVFAVGVMAYEMVTGGYYPWQREESRMEYLQLAPAELCLRQLSTAPVDPRTRNTELPPALADAILAMLAVAPESRPEDRAAALRLAQAAPTDGVNPDGLGVLREVAPDLVKSDNLDETLRSQRDLASEGEVPATATRYQLGNKLGMGGMAEVFVGTQFGAEGFERRVAIKRVLSGYSNDPSFEQMFTAEARLVCQLAHPNIVGVLDFSRDPEGRLFLVMEYVQGRDLAALFDTGPVPISTVIYIIAEILRGLDYAHNLPDPSAGGLGVVHRDVTPKNILLSYEGEVKVADFGLARMRDASGKVHSETVRGTPSYMSPEQCAGEPLDGRSDLRAVGVILWELLAQKHMYTGTAREVVGQVLFKDIPPPSAMTRARVPADLEAIAMRLIAQQRTDRYPSAKAALVELLRCEDAPRDGRGELAALLASRFPPPGRRTPAVALDAAQVAAAPPAAAQPHAQSTLGSAASQSVSVETPPPPPRSSRSIVTFVGVAVGVGILVGGGAALYRRAVRGDAERAPLRAAVSTSADAARSGPVDSAAAAPDAVAVAVDAVPPADAAVPPDATPPVDAAVQPPPRPPADAAVPIDAPAPPDPRKSRSGTQAAQARGTGAIFVQVTSWAAVWVDGRKLGETPLRAKLPAGSHTVRLLNPEAHKDERFTITVTPDRTTEIKRSW